MTSCTVVIPTHNRAQLLERAVRSALSACPADGEVLVIDDKSSVAATQSLRAIADPRLRVMVNDGRSGAASTRNFGVLHALGAVVFFLDDDDEMLPEHCRRVLEPRGPAEQAGWGFCSTIERRGHSLPVDTPRLRKRLSSGLVPRGARVRDWLAAMSDGFWIQRSLFLQVGALDPVLTIDEDTDLCLRLVAAGHWPWYEGRPGVVVYRDYQPASGDGSQLTVSTPAQRALDCYRRTYQKNAPAYPENAQVRWYLATRFLRRAVKAGREDLAWELVNELDEPGMRMAAGAYVRFKSVVRLLRRPAVRA